MRSLRVGWLVLRHGLAALLRRPAGHTGPQRLRRLLEELGGTYIKFGQLLALQPDILPRRYGNALFDLLDRVPPFGYAEVERTFVEDLGRPPEEIFERFESSPFAAASIGQVHRAVYRGRVVAVKVRRPDAERVFESDLRLLGRVARVIVGLGLRRLEWLVRMIDELYSWTQEELDYRFEARFMDALGFNARDNPRAAVPELIAELTTRRILVAGYLDGPTVLDYIRFCDAGGADQATKERMAPIGFDPEAFARNVLRNFVSDAFRHGLFHADLHPANLLILADNVVGYVDFGITGSFSAHSRRNIVALILAMTRGDSEVMLEHFLRVAQPWSWSDVPAYARGLRRLVDQWYGQEDGRRRLLVSFTTVMVDVLRLSRRTSLWPTPDAIRYMRSIITVDSVIGRFAPNFDLGRYLEEVCREEIEDELSRSWTSPEALLDWATTGARVLLRAPEALALLWPPERARQDGATSPPRRRRRQREQRAAQFALLGSAALVLAALAGPPTVLGWNVFTVNLALGGLGALGFALTSRKPT